jgi:hypothetical protein
MYVAWVGVAWSFSMNSLSPLLGVVLLAWPFVCSDDIVTNGEKVRGKGFSMQQSEMGSLYEQQQYPRGGRSDGMI